MNQSMFLAARMRCVLLALAVAGCSTDAPGGPPPGGDSMSPDARGNDPTNPGAGAALPCEVERVLQQRCQACHQKPPQFGAPMPLLTWSDTQARAPGGQMSVNQMMKVNLETGKMPPPSTPTGPLSVAEKTTLLTWLNAGAPRDSQASCAPPDAGEAPGPPGRPPAEALPCTPNHEFRASGATATDPFAVPLTGDTYRCFSFAVPFAAPEQAIAWSPIIDDSRVVHHWILYGHTGNTRPVGCGDPGRVFLMGWAPGGRNGIMPADVGLELPNPGSWLTLEVHYNNKAGLTDARDRSGVAMCTTTSPRPKEAGVITLGSVGIVIPPGADDFDVISDIPGNLTQVLPETLHVLWTSPHMHANGKALRTDITRAGRTTNLVEVTDWDFANQQSFSRDPDTTLIQPGDSLRTTCTFRNPTTNFIRFGEKTENEMCFNFVVAYPITRVSPRQWVTR